MVGQMTLVYIILRHNQEQECYQINVNLKTQRGGRGGSNHSLLLYHGRVLGYELFVQSKCANEQP